MSSESPTMNYKEQMFAYARDLAAIYQAEKEKRHQLEVTIVKMHAAFNGISDAIVSIDNSLIIEESNVAFTRLIDSPADQLIGMNLSAVLTDKDWLPLFQRLESLMHREEILINPDGKRLRYILVTLAPIFLASGKRRGTVLTMRDETRRKRNESLKEELLSLVSHEMMTPITVISGYLSHLEHTLGDRLSSPEREFFVHVDSMLTRLTTTVKELLDVTRLADETKESRQHCDLKDCVDSALERSAGKLEEKDISITLLPHHDAYPVSGFPARISEALEYVIDNAVKFSDSSKTITVTLGEFHDTWCVDIVDEGPGMSPEEIDGALETFHQSEFYLTRSHEGLGLGLPIVLQIMKLHKGSLHLENVTQGNGLSVTLRFPKLSEATEIHHHQSPEEAITELTRKLDLLQKQNIQYAEDLAKTYSDRKSMGKRLKKTEQQLIRSEKLSLMGQMVAGITHELNNMLNPIVGYSDLILRREDSLDPKIVKWTTNIKESAWRAAEFLAQSLDFSRQTSSRLERINCTERLEKTLQFLEFKIRKSKAKIVTSFPEHDAYINGNPGEIDQVFTNLIVNALHAMEDVQTGRELFLGIDQSSETDTEKISSLVFTLADTGCGIAPENLEKIFEPFFTTKEEGKGTGLGMFIVHSIIERHGGTISVESTVGKGTTFTILLPGL